VTGPVTDQDPRCDGVYRGKRCNKLLARLVTRPWAIECPRCGKRNSRQPQTYARFMVRLTDSGDRL